MRRVVGLVVLAGLCWLALAPVHGQAPGSGTHVAVGNVRFDFAPDGSGGRYPSTISAGESTKLRLAILNQAGEAVAAGSVVSVLVTTSVGELSTTVGGGCTGARGSAGELACQLPTPAINASNSDRLDVTLTHPGGSESGRASVGVRVLTAAGGHFSPPTLTVTLTGESSAEVSGPTAETEGTSGSSTGSSEPPPEPESDFSIVLSLVGEPDNTVAANSQAVTVAASLVYDGTNQRPRTISDLVLRVSGSLEWDSNGRSSLRIADQSVSCTAAGGQVGCPLNLVSDGFDPQITIPSGTPTGTFTISASAQVGGQSTSGSLLVAIGGSAPPTSTPTPTTADGVGEVRFDFVQGSGQPAPTLSAGESTTLRLAILDRDGAAAAARSIASILVTTTAGRLSAPVGGGCAGSLACQLPVSAINASNADRLDVTLTHPGGDVSGRASIQATVLSVTGERFAPPALTVTLAGVREPSTEAGGNFSISLSLVGKPDNTVAANSQAVTVAASLVYDGDSQGPYNISDLVLRISGSLEWDSNGRSSLRIADQAVSCTAAGGQVRCPLSLVSDGFNPEITIPSGTPAGTFTISASAQVGGQTASGSLLVTIGDSAAPEPTTTPPVAGPGSEFAFVIGLVDRANSTVAPGETIEVSAGLAYVGSGVGSRTVSGVTLRVSGGFEWESNGRGSLAVSDQTVACVTDGDQIVCPLDLQPGGATAQIVIPAGTPAGAFVISGAATVGGREDRDALRVVVTDAVDEAASRTDTLEATAEPLSSRTPNNYAAYLSNTATTASALLAELDGVSALFVWSGGGWISYGVAGGVVVPGSIEADIVRGTVLWLGG